MTPRPTTTDDPNRRNVARAALVLVLVTLTSLLAGGAAASAAEHPAATPGREGAAARFLAYAPAAPAPSAVCIVDTGIDTNPDTAAALLHSEAVLPDQAQGGDTDTDRKHGTRVLGVAAAPRNDWGTIGIWPQLKAVSINGTRPDRASFPFDSYRLGIRRCVTISSSLPILAVNLSLGSASPPSESERLALLDAVAYARSNGINVVAAAGNLGGAVETPAALDGVFAVGASVPATGALCDFSARGEGLDISFPGCGVALASPTGEPIFGQGTTYAAPGVSAVLVAMRTFKPALSVDEAEQILRDTARGGVVDARAAFVAAGLGWVVAEGERRAEEAEAVPRDDPGTTPPERVRDPGTAPVGDPPLVRSQPKSWPAPRVTVSRRDRTITIKVAGRPRAAQVAVAVEARRGEFSWRTLAQRQARSSSFRLTLARSIPSRTRLRVRAQVLAAAGRRASPLTTVPQARFRLGPL